MVGKIPFRTNAANKRAKIEQTVRSPKFRTGEAVALPVSYDPKRVLEKDAIARRIWNLRIKMGGQLVDESGRRFTRSQLANMLTKDLMKLNPTLSQQSVKSSVISTLQSKTLSKRLGIL